LTITYNPKVEGAQLSGNDDIYVVLDLAFAERERLVAKMAKAGELFTYELPVMAPVPQVSCFFITMSEFDQKAHCDTLIYHPDGKPVRGAYLASLRAYYPEKYLEFFRQEIALYPDSYLAYAKKWLYAGIDPKVKDNLTEIVETDMAILNKERHQTDELLCALAYGHLLLKEEEVSRQILKTLISQHPTSPSTEEALDLYERHVYAQQITGEGPAEIKKLKWELIEKYPHTRLARRSLEPLSQERDFPFGTLEAIAQEWIRKESENPLPHFYLATACNSHKQKIDIASIHIERATNLLLQDKLRLFNGPFGRQSDQYLPSAYLTGAELFLQLNNFAKALSSVKAAQALEEEIGHRSYELEGRIWEAISNLARAEQAYWVAWQRGSKEAEESLREIYERRHGSLAGFEDYVSKKNPTDTAGPARKKAAPSFSVTALDGKQIDLGTLRGKLVVLNFWFIDCAPCRVEIPRLNQLVREFKPRDKDIVFIAFALDKKEELQTFLRKQEFAYQIVAASEDLADKFGVSAFPTHIVLDREGRVEWKVAGEDEQTYEHLRRVIERELK